MFKKYLVLPIIIIYILSPYLRFRQGKEAFFVKLPESPNFEGNLEKNDKLKNAFYLAKGKLRGPETILFINNTLYTGLVNGQLIRLDSEGNIDEIITQSGDDSIENCKYIQSSNKNCGLILGMRYKKPNFIYMVDAYNGLLKVNLETKEKTYLLKSDDKLFGNEPLIFANDLDLDDNGNIYFTQSSTKHTIEEGLDLYFDAAPFGRLFKYNENTKDLNILVDGIRFANGVQLTPEKDALIISEISMSRLLKYNLSGSKKGSLEVFINVPGSPDNIRKTDHNTLLVPLVIARSNDLLRITPLDIFGEYPKIRKILSMFVNIPQVIFKLPKYSLIIEYDFNGKVVKSWHDPSGKIVDFATCVALNNNKLYIGSFYIDHIAVIDY